MGKAIFGLLVIISVWVWVFWDLPPRLKAAEQEIAELKIRVEQLENQLE